MDKETKPVVYIPTHTPSADLLKALGDKRAGIVFRNAEHFNPSDLEATGLVILDEAVVTEKDPKDEKKTTTKTVPLANAKSIVDAYGALKRPVQVVSVEDFVKGKYKKASEAAPKLDADAPLAK